MAIYHIYWLQRAWLASLLPFILSCLMSLRWRLQELLAQEFFYLVILSILILSSVNRIQNDRL
jgi:hypothetical protein